MSPAPPNLSPNTPSPFPQPARGVDAHKGNFGRVVLIGGSRGMAGSIAMSAMAAMKSGSGLVAVAVPDRCLETVASFHPAMMTIPIRDNGLGRFALDSATEVLTKIESADAIAVGPGMTTESGSKRIVRALIGDIHRPMVIDADGLNCLAAIQTSDLGALDRGKLNQVVLTPHPGELQRLTGVSSKNRQAQIDSASRLAEESGATIVIKGGPTVVTDGKRTYINRTGNPGMATGGAGDVLTGVITSLLGQGMTPWEASCQGVWIHGLAGDIAAWRHGEVSMTAMEILAALDDAIRQTARVSDGP